MSLYTNNELSKTQVKETFPLIDNSTGKYEILREKIKQGGEWFVHWKL